VEPEKPIVNNIEKVNTPVQSQSDISRGPSQKILFFFFFFFFFQNVYNNNNNNNNNNNKNPVKI